MHQTNRHAVVLLSGGLDSATALAIAQADGFIAHALSFRYGQRHASELDAAARVASALAAVEHIVVDIDLRRFGGSALTADIPVPKDRPLPDRGDPAPGMSQTPGATRTSGTTAIPITYVPARNTVFLSFALAWAETLGAGDIFIGVNALDYSGYPDCRPAYIAAFERMANLATAAAVEGRQRMRIHSPLITMSKAEIIRRGIALGVDYGLTSSCYDPATDGRPCLRCDSCLLRARGFAEAGCTDPLLTRFGLTTG